MKVNVELIYPAVSRKFPNPSYLERRIPITLNIGCPEWKTNTAMRKAFCELLFSGAGNCPSQWDGIYGGELMEFDSGDQGINNVHRQWKVAKTRSMSVGDIVRIDPKGLNEYWVCASVGFTLLSEEEAKDWLSFPREYGCCSLELKKWSVDLD